MANSNRQNPYPDMPPMPANEDATSATWGEFIAWHIESQTYTLRAIRNHLDTIKGIMIFWLVLNIVGAVLFVLSVA